MKEVEPLAALKLHESKYAMDGWLLACVVVGGVDPQPGQTGVGGSLTG